MKGIKRIPALVPIFIPTTVFFTTSLPWSFVNGNKAVQVVVAGPVIASDFPTLLGAAMQGLGLAQVPGPVAAPSVKAGRLARVLEPFAPTLPGVFLYYPDRRQIMPKLRAFIDHVKRHAAQRAHIRLQQPSA